MKILQIGAGRWGLNHVRAWSSLGIGLFVAELDEKQRDRCRQGGIPADCINADYHEFLEEADAVDVVTPAGSHHRIVKEALARGKDVFVEKPLAATSLEALDLAREAALCNRILQVGHIFRNDPASRWLREAINRGDFGRMKLLRGEFSGFKRPRDDSGVALADAIHFVDLFTFLLGRSPTRVVGILRDFLGRGIDDEAFISLEYDDPERGGAWASIECGYHVPGKLRRICVAGDALAAVCDYNESRFKITTYRNRHQRTDGRFDALEGEVNRLEFPPEEPLALELSSFARSLTSRERPIADGWAGYEAVRVIEAAMESARSGRAVDLEGFHGADFRVGMIPAIPAAT